MKNDSSPDDPASEQQRLLEEALALDRRGQVRQAELAALEARIQKAMEENDRKLEERLAAIKHSSVAEPPRLPRRWQALALLLLVYPLVGLMFEMTLGYSFVFALADKYWAMAHWIFFGVLILWACLLLQAGVRQRNRGQHRNWLLRWLMLPMLGALAAGAFVFASPGWAALFGWLSGGPVITVEAHIVSISVSTIAKGGCRQKAKLLANDVFAILCLDGRAPTPVPTASEQVLLVGRNSWFGLLVHEIRRR
jgi:hypothetical protein